MYDYYTIEKILPQTFTNGSYQFIIYFQQKRTICYKNLDLYVHIYTTFWF